MCVFTDKLDSVKVDQSQVNLDAIKFIRKNLSVKIYSVHESNFRLSDKLETVVSIQTLDVK